MTTMKRPDFIDSPYFVDEPNNWHLKPGAPKEVIKEFNEFMRSVERPFVELTRIGNRKTKITLHEAIGRVISEYGPSTIQDIADKLNIQKIYERRDGKPIPANQIRARIQKYPHMFLRKGEFVYLNEENKILFVEASVGGYFGISYQVKIDLKNMKVVYSTLENGHSIIGDKVIDIDDSTIERFELEIKSIGILSWRRKYIDKTVLDGTSWTVSIRTDTGISEYSGSNAFPKGWDKFCCCIEDIVKGEFR